MCFYARRIISLEEGLKATIKECKKELRERKMGIQGDCTVEQIAYSILPELYHYLYLSMHHKLPPKHKRWLEIAFMFTDGWIDTSIYHKSSKMVDMIMDLDHVYFA